MKDTLLYRQVRSVKCGQTERFVIRYTPLEGEGGGSNPIPPSLWLKVKNTELMALRAAYLAGPYVLYVDCTPEDYSSTQQCFVTADQPVFEPQLLPGQLVYAELACHSIKHSYVWTVDVTSQTLFNPTIDVDFEVTVGTSKQVLHLMSHPAGAAAAAATEATGGGAPAAVAPVANALKLGVFSPALQVTTHDTLDLWNLPVPDPLRDVHLVVLTHGLHSNVLADMLYLKEEIDRVGASGASCGCAAVGGGGASRGSGSSPGPAGLGSSPEPAGSGSSPESAGCRGGCGEQLVVKGFFGNVGKTERGVKYLGSRVAEFVVDLLTKTPSLRRTTKISFVGHLLGGLVQTFAIAYLAVNFPWVFRQAQPVNFVAIALPLLGVVHENPLYVKLALLAGIVGKTGQDLGLVFMEGDQAPLLLLLPAGATHKVLQRFRRRTVYANVKNDIIVPLRTSALLYLDYRAVWKVMSGEAEGGPAPAGDAAEGAEGGVGGPETTATKIPSRDEFEGAGAGAGQSGGQGQGQGQLASSLSGLLPLQAVLSFFMPQKQAASGGDSGSAGSGAAGSEYQRFQTGLADESDPIGAYVPKSSVLESATSLILPPLPLVKYITDPAARPNVIVHDKVYHPWDIPPRGSAGGETQEETKDKAGSLMGKLRGILEAPARARGDAAPRDASESPDAVSPSTVTPSLRKRLTKLLESAEHLEEEIAREYHKEMAWRKVLVALRPDAHNNIIVRRRYANAHGWPVIAHLVQNHFGAKADDAASADAVAASDSLDELDLSRILSRELITKQNAEVDRESSRSGRGDHWTNSKDDSESMFAVGPTGLLLEVSEMMCHLREHWYSRGKGAGGGAGAAGGVGAGGVGAEQGKEGDLGLGRQVMGEFM